MWRQVNWPSFNFDWRRAGKVSDTLHALDGRLLRCFVHGLAHYAFWPSQQLHYLRRSTQHFVDDARVAFMVESSIDSNPVKGMLNPVYDIVPRNARYDPAICRRLSDFVWDEASNSSCCPNPGQGYCCPNSLRTCSRATLSPPS